MKKKKFQELDALVENLGISDEEVTEWFYSRPLTLVKTALPLVYKDGDKLSTKIGLLFDCAHKLWGIQILPDVVLSLKSRNGHDQPFGKDEARAFAESVSMNGMQGSLPTLEVLKRFNNEVSTEAFRSTIATLKEYGIYTVSSGVVWVEEESVDSNVLFGIGSYGEEVIRKERKSFKSKVARYAVMF